jgi:hypothetical protein
MCDRLIHVGVLVTLCTGDGASVIIISFEAMVDIVTVMVWLPRSALLVTLEDQSSIGTTRLYN